MQQGKPGRNEPCWCGSGLKYKKCHLDRENQPAISRGELEESTKEIKNRKLCSAPIPMRNECKSSIVRAHTISKSACLKAIASNGHVIGGKASLSLLSKSNGKIVPSKIGINQASTFTGFCTKHDKELFSKIEDEYFSPNKEKCFLLAYRPIARELYTKEGNKITANLLRKADRGMDRGIQESVQSVATQFDTGVEMALHDLRTLKQDMDDCLIKSDYENYRHYVFELSSPPQTVASASIFTEYDFDGRTLQNLGKSNAHAIIFNCFSSDGNGFFIFSWDCKSDEVNTKFIESLIGKDSIGDILTCFLFSYCENTFSSPIWWDSLEDNLKNSIQERMMHGTSFMNPTSSDCLSRSIFNYNSISVEKGYYL